MEGNDLQGYGQSYVVSEQQKLDWCDPMFLVTFPFEKEKFQALATQSTKFQYVILY